MRAINSGARPCFDRPSHTLFLWRKPISSSPPAAKTCARRMELPRCMSLPYYQTHSTQVRHSTQRQQHKIAIQAACWRKSTQAAMLCDAVSPASSVVFTTETNASDVPTASMFCCRLHDTLSTAPNVLAERSRDHCQASCSDTSKNVV